MLWIIPISTYPRTIDKGYNLVQKFTHLFGFPINRTELQVVRASRSCCNFSFLNSDIQKGHNIKFNGFGWVHSESPPISCSADLSINLHLLWHFMVLFLWRSCWNCWTTIWLGTICHPSSANIHSSLVIINGKLRMVLWLVTMG